MIPLCRAYMLNNLDAPVSQLCVLQWLKMAKLRSDIELETAIMDFVECNFSLVMQTPDFMATDLDIVVSLLASSRLVVHNETMLLYATLMWLETFVESSHHSDESIRKVFHSVLRHIRWTMLTSEEIACLQDCSVIRQFFQKYRQYCIPQQFPLYILQQLCLNEKKDFFQTESLYFSCGELYQKASMCKENMQSCSGKFKSTMQADVDCAHCNKTSKYHHRNTEEILPRVYINDYWCTALTISNFHAFPQYGTQTFLFSTPGISDTDSYVRNTLEWEVEMCPKGVHFPPAVLIGLERDGNKLVEESYLKTVRLSVMSHSEQELPLKVEVNVLIQTNSCAASGRTFVERCVSRTCIFDSVYQRHNLDDIVRLEEIAKYLRPESSVPSLHLTSFMAFTLYIVMKRIPYISSS
ncbi:hypothetical protein EGW08_002884 [Elysia chlorotica]|uniref:BACK domain-containing protein n=1 Tax=Elysia chlorotica TaxID=188477 RepID=A0A3S1BIV9_ELYCH|nr:hypothetical protein EGW08_002884 [Elysia chlorotica]